MTAVDATAVSEIADLATCATEPSALELGKYYTVIAGGQLHKVDLTGDQYQAQPRRKIGATAVRDVASFAAYWAKHRRDSISEVYANRDALAVVAVLDAHGADPDATGWAQHRLVLGLKHSAAFMAWKSGDARDMTQEEFAEFLEDNRADIASPPAAEMLEVAQSIQAATKVDFSAGYRLADGQRRLSYTETVESRAGTKGELAIPAEIRVRLPVFDGAEVADELTARFRHRIVNGQLRLSYRLDRPDDVVSSAFEGIVAEVGEACATTVLRGQPA
jgi:uncharacterized protein YfdQ (DUF2303 family)